MQRSMRLLNIWRHMALRLAFDRSCGQAFNEVFLEHEEEKHDGDRGDDRTGRKKSPLGAKVTHIGLEQDGQGKGLFVAVREVKSNVMRKFLIIIVLSL